MRYSLAFPKTTKTTPSDTEAINAHLLTKGGFIHQEMAGVYTYLPLGLRVMNNLSRIVREETDKIGGQEILMPVLQPGENWKKTGRFNTFDVLYKLKGGSGSDLVLGPTHEEIIYPLMAEYTKSYKDLPMAIYQIQTKFRDEPRAKSGLLRTREFVMKDLYSFHSSDKDRDQYYEEVRKAYLEVYRRIGLPVVETKASGGTFSDISEEFQVVTPAGEDVVYICKGCQKAFNKEVFDLDKCSDCGGEFEEKKAVEVANIFPLKKSYAETFNLYFTDSDGTKKIVSAGCFGFGISRTMGTIVEVFHDEKGIIWPEAVAPFLVHLVGLDLENEEIRQQAEKVYKLLQAEGVEVLFDDRVNISPGEKFADADLIGIPFRVVVSKRTQDKLEIKQRSATTTYFVSMDELVKQICR